MPIDKQSLHRLLKAVVDSGRVQSFDEATEFMKRLHLNIFVGEAYEDFRFMDS